MQATRSTSAPCVLKTAPGTSVLTMHNEERDGRAILVCTVGNTLLH